MIAESVSCQQQKFARLIPQVSTATCATVSARNHAAFPRCYARAHCLASDKKPAQRHQSVISPNGEASYVKEFGSRVTFLTPARMLAVS
jgi:hypothetical protein